MRNALFLAACCLSQCGYAQSQGLGGAIFYDVRTKAFTPIVVSPIATLHDVLGHKGWQVTLDGLSGLSSSNAPLIGFGASAKFALAKEVFASVGVGTLSEQQRKQRFGLYAGIEFRF